VRILAPLTHELAGSMGQWRKAVAPWAEKVSHLLGEVLRGKYTPVTPFTGKNYVGAERAVKVRRTQEAIYRDVFTRDSPPHKQRIKGESKVPLRNCVECGGPLLRGVHQRCPTGGGTTPGQDFYTRKGKGEGISRSRGGGEEVEGGAPSEGGPRGLPEGDPPGVGGRTPVTHHGGLWGGQIHGISNQVGEEGAGREVVGAPGSPGCLTLHVCHACETTAPDHTRLTRPS